MDRKDSRYYLSLPYPDNLIRTICVDDAEITEDRKTGLKHSLRTMTDREREVLDFRFRERKSFREIAEMFGVPVEKIRVIYGRSLRKLQKTYRFPMISLGYNASLEANKNADEAKRKEDEEAFKKAVEETGNPEVWEMSVQKLDLSVRVMNRLAENKIESVMDLWILSQRHPDEYYRIRNLGEIGQAEINKQLRNLGFILKGESKDE